VGAVGQLERLDALDKTLRLILGGPPANLVIQRAADAFEKRIIGRATHGHLGPGRLRAGGESEPGRKGWIC
jgi:hypothetical protein